MKKFSTLLKRELWEYKTGFITLPLICTLILSLLLSVGFLRFAPPAPNPHTATNSTPVINSAPATNPTSGNPAQPNGGNLGQQFSAFSSLPMDELPIFSHIEALRSAAGFIGFSQWVLAAILNIILIVVTLNYAHRTLFDDRKNREILFWRSMPVTETENLMAKFLIVYGVAPLMLLAMFLLGSFIAWLVAVGHGTQDSLQAFSKVLDAFIIYGKTLLFLFALLPLITWTFLAAAYAKKSPFLVSTFLPLGLMVFDRLVQGTVGINLYIRASIGAYTDYLSQILKALGGGLSLSQLTASIPFILISAAFAAITVWLRNNRYEI